MDRGANECKVGSANIHRVSGMNRKEIRHDKGEEIVNWEHGIRISHRGRGLLVGLRKVVASPSKSKT